ncbi:transcriptional initiation protein Tat [Clostridiales bacterium PH28_bin88]|nr:transcriptional initiation protein Tat [Clostridiales bacterium PH28_bin88]
MGAGAAVAGAVTAASLVRGKGGVPTAKAMAATTRGKTGEVTYVKGICEMCVYRCGLIARVEDGVVTKLEGDPDHPNSRGKLCPRGNAGIMHLYDPDRLKFPMMRAGERGSGRWRRVTWEEALDYTAGEMHRIKETYGPEAMILSATHHLAQPYFENLLQAYGTPNYGTQRSLCFNAMTMSFLFTFGVAQPGVDYTNARYIIYTGRNLAEAISNAETQAMMEFAARGGKMVVLDPRFSITASKATEWLPVRPGTDLAFFLAILQVIVTEELYDREFVADHTTGFDELAAAVAGYTPEWAEVRCEIPSVTIRRIAREFAAAKPAAVAHPNWRTSNFINSFQTERAIAVLNVLMGNWGKPGGLIPEDESSGPELGTMPQPPYPPARAMRLDGVPWQYPLVPLKYGIIQNIRDALLSGKPYQGRGWLVDRQNPLLSLSDRYKTMAAFQKLEFLGVIDVIPNDTAYYADVVLPESTYLERWDPIAVAGNRLFLRRPVVEPLYDTKSALMIFKELGTRLGLGEFFPYNNEKELIQAQLAPFGTGLNELIEKGYAEVEVPEHDPHHFQTPSGKAEIASTALGQVGKKAVPAWEEPPAPPPGKFYLLSGKVAQHSQFGSQNNAWLMELFGENPLWIHTAPANKLGIQTGDFVVVESKVGKLITRAYVTEGIRPDCVFLVAGFGHLSKGLTVGYGRGVSSSALHETHTDPVSGGQALSETFVTVAKADWEVLKVE